MLVMTYSEARQNLASFLSQTVKDGEAIIKRADGTLFKVVPLEKEKKSSPFSAVRPLQLKKKITRSELMEIMNDSRSCVDRSQKSLLMDKPSSFFGCFRK